MAYTQVDIDRLKKAIATGALETRTPDGRYTQFRSLEEMERILQNMIDEVGLPVRRPRQYRFRTSKGLGF